MKPLIALLFLLFAAAALLQLQAATPVASNDDQTKIRHYLSIKYDECHESQRGTIYYGPVFDEDAALVPLEVQGISTYLPDTRFYATALHGPNMCFHRVPLIVAIRTTKKGDDIRTCISPTYAAPSQKFLAMFNGTQAASELERKRLVTVLGDLLSVVIHDGNVQKARVNGNTASAELTWNGSPFRTILLSFNRNGTVRSAVLSPRLEAESN